jgi:hypothetical protein
MITLSRTRGAAAHRRDTAILRPLLKSVGAVLAAIAIGVLGAGTTFAFLNATAGVVSATTVTAGTASFTVTTNTALAGGNLTPLAGSAAYGTYTLTNSGDVKLAITPTVTPASGNSTTLANTKLELALVADGTDCSTLTYSQWSKTGSAASSGALAVLGARDRISGSTATPAMRLCAKASLLSTAPVAAEDGTVTFTVLLDGVQAW